MSARMYTDSAAVAAAAPAAAPAAVAVACELFAHLTGNITDCCTSGIYFFGMHNENTATLCL